MPRIALPAGVADPNRTARLVSRVLLVLVSVVVGWIVLRPGPPDPDGQYALGLFIYHQHKYGLPHWITFSLLEGLSNVVLFVPLGLLGALSLRRHCWSAVLALAALSALIELSQWLLLPDRVASPRDVINNSIGALVGYLLALPIVLRRRRRVRAAVTGRRIAGLRSTARTVAPPTQLQPA
jgi:hypothetical protein